MINYASIPAVVRNGEKRFILVTPAAAPDGQVRTVGTIAAPTEKDGNWLCASELDGAPDCWLEQLA
jgi:hypothetical protein